MELYYTEYKLLIFIKPFLRTVTEPLESINNPLQFSKAVVSIANIFSVKKHREYIYRNPNKGCKETFFRHNLKKKELEYLRECFPQN